MMDSLDKKRQIKVGCCGFAGAQRKYFDLFKVVEIQQTFYQIPQIETAEQWRSSAPPDFEFTLKAWQLITHLPASPTYRRLRERIDPERAGAYGGFQATGEVMDAWKRTATFARALGASIVVFQCPASFRPLQKNVKNIRTFFSRIDRTGFTFAWEPRGAWPNDLIEMLCEELSLIHCVDPFKNEGLWGNIDYFRLHGVAGYAHTYTDEELDILRKKIRQKPTYVLFNNTAMKEDALRFLNLLKP